ncbi:MAG: 1-acyl-sn-glycerol-3-phosphate acyltransferase [Candidatus Vogelbacteria bacterium]|nr:1-acyl-sn-glycerol-3-phosphate acyltransferase [Candidatus Vogelbacteria bacterium]
MRKYIASFLQRLFFVPIRFYLWYVGYQVIGGENIDKIPKDKPLIIVSNHTTVLDPIYAVGAFPLFSHFIPVHFVALKREEYTEIGRLKYITDSWFFRLFGTYPAILRTRNYEKALPSHINFLAHKLTVAIFPEGQINRSNQLLNPARSGVSYLAWRSRATILPIGFKYTKRVRPIESEGADHPVSAIVGKPFNFEELGGSYEKEYARDEHKKFAEIILNRVARLLQ